MTDESNHYHVFDTAAGFAAIGWRADRITSLRLPARDAAEADRAVRRRLAGTTAAIPSGEVAKVVAAVKRYFNGERVSFDDVPIDLGAQDTFFSAVYAAVRRLGWGETTTYGALARELGAGPEAARDVGQAMAQNPLPLIVPCHRVTGAGGKIGGFSAPGGSISKARMLELEGVAIAATKTPPEPAQQNLGF